MESHQLEVEPRTAHGKGVARKLRAAGKLPGILYGHKEAAQSLILDPHELRTRLRKSGRGRNTVFELKGLGRDVLALLKDVQTDPVRRNLVHVDLIEVRKGDSTVVDIPIEYIGKSKGVVEGGSLQISRRSLTVNASPLSIPTKIVLDITAMQIGDVKHVGDMELPDGVTAAIPESLTLCLIRAPRTEKVADATAEAEGIGTPAAGEDAPADA